MFQVPLRYRHWSYIWIPIITGLVWFGTLWAMLITWLAQGRPRYVSMEGSIAYISDVGADILKPLFIAGTAVTGVGFFLCLIIERYLRHSGRLMPHMRRRERVFSTLACMGAFMGGCGLILLAVFDTKRYVTLHRIFLLVFMLGVALSAIFTIIEYRWIAKDFREARSLRIAYAAKGIIATTLIVLAIAFGFMLYKRPGVGAILEWVIAMMFTFYVFTYYYDLRQSKNVDKGELHSYRMSATGSPNRNSPNRATTPSTAGHQA